jgi:hypothetical protein
VGTSLRGSCSRPPAALELIEHAVACIRLTRDGVDDNRERHIVDTQVRILMKMGRTKDACGVVRELARQNRHLPEFDDILNHPDYWGTLTP